MTSIVTDIEKKGFSIFFLLYTKFLFSNTLTKIEQYLSDWKSNKSFNNFYLGNSLKYNTRFEERKIVLDTCMT